MNCRNFSQFDEWKPARLVWDGAEAPATGEAPPPEAKPDATPVDPAIAEAAQAERGARVAEAAQAGQPDPAAAETILAQLGIEVKATPKEGQSPLTVEQIEAAFAKANPQQLLMLDSALSAEVSAQEKIDLQKKFDANGLLDWQKLGQALAEGKLSVRELVVMSALLEANPTAITPQGVDKAPLQQGSERLKMLQAALEKQMKPKYALEQVDQLFKKPEYDAAYTQFIKDGDKAKFLAAITNEADKPIIEWAISAPPTILEKKAVAAKYEALINQQNQEAIGKAVVAGTMNYREGMIAKALVDDIQRIAEQQDKIPDELKGLGFMGLLEKLIEKITKLLEKLTNQIDKAFKKPSEQFATSPIGGDQKFVIEKANKGVNLRAEKAGLDVKYAVPGKGKVVEVGPDYVKIQAGKGFIIYSGITLAPTVTKDAEVSEGTKLGVMKTDVLNFQMLGEDSKQIDPTKLLGKYVKSPETKPAEAPALNVTASPIALAASQKLNITKPFSSGQNGIEITAPKDTPVVMMADGIITKSENGTVEVSYKDGKIVKFTGLKNDASLKAAKADEIVKAGTNIGAVNDTGILGIQLIQNNAQTDPAALLANYLPTTAPARAPVTPPANPPPPK